MDRNLEQFLAIADAGSYVAAAEALDISQPALSYNLKKLEERLGVRLFERSSRGVRLTNYGEILYENAAMMSRLYGNAIDAIAQQKQGHEEGIKIGVGYSTWHLFLRELLVDKYNSEDFGTINVSLANELACMDQLLAGEISLFIGHHIANLAHDNMVQFIPLGQVHPSFSVRKGHPLLGAPRTLAEIRAYPAIQVKSHDERYARLLESADSSKPKMYPDMALETPTPRFVSNSLSVCMDILRESDSVLFHSILSKRLMAERGFFKVELAKDVVLTTWTMGIYVSRDRAKDARVAELVEVIEANRYKILDRQDQAR